MPETILNIVLYVAPMYFANSSALIFGGRTPIDLGTKFLDGKPIFGKGKTYKGLVFGTLAGVFVAGALSVILPVQTFAISSNYLLLGFLLSLGAVLGDMAASFLKRRIGMEQGKELIIIDQLDFVIGAMVLGSILYLPTLVEIVIIMLATLVIHRISNYVAYVFKLKKVPW